MDHQQLVAMLQSCRQGAACSIESDLICIKCNYNLRGLLTTGRCPECGCDIGATVKVRAEQLAYNPNPLTEADHRWLNTIIEGVWCLLIAYVMIIVVSFAPGMVFKWNTPHRAFALSFLCARCVIECYGVWQFATPEPMAGSGKASWLLRFSAMSIPLFAIGQAFAPTRNDDPLWLLALVILPLLAVSLTSPAILYFKVLNLAARGGGGALVGISFAMMLLGTITYLSIFFPEFDSPVDSLHFMLKMPSIPYGSVYTTFRCLRIVLGGNPNVIDIGGLLALLLSFTALAWLQLILFKARANSVPPSSSASTANISPAKSASRTACIRKTPRR